MKSDVFKLRPDFFRIMRAAVKFDVLQHRDKDVGAGRLFIMMIFLWQKEANLQFCCLLAYTAALILLASTEAWLRVVAQASAPKPKAA